MWPALLTLALSQTPAASTVDTKRLEQALQLSGPSAAAAEEALRADRAGSVPALSFAVRAHGPMALIPVMRSDAIGCGSATMFIGSSAQFAEATPASAAATLLVALAREDEPTRFTLAQSGHPLELLLAVLSAWSDEAALERLATRMEVAALDQTTQRLATALSHCALRGGGAVKAPHRRALVSRLLQAASKPLDCDTAADAAAVLERQPIATRGWNASGPRERPDVTVSLEAAGATVVAKPECVLALYEATFDPKLPAALVAANAPQKDVALAHLDRDLARFDKEGRKAALSALISEGRRTELLREFSAFERANREELVRGALLAGAPEAQALLFSRTGCPFVSWHIELLSLLKDKRAARAEANRVAVTCTREGVAAAKVLASFGDTSWVKQVPRYAEDDFARHDLSALLEAQWSPKLESQLKALPASNEPFVKWRGEFLERMARKAK